MDSFENCNFIFASETTTFSLDLLLRVLNLIGNNAFSRGVFESPFEPPNGTIAKIVSFSLS